MTDQTVIDLGIKTLWVTVEVAAPALLAAMVIGFVVSVFQAATQINEQTLTFIPKILAMGLALVFFGPWIIQVMMNFTIDMIRSIPQITQ